jgi:protein-S-isoprenylcysteine O-methyltransferase Ste14
MTSAVVIRRRFLPPQGLLASLVAQLPLLFSALSVRPALPEITAGLVLLAFGTVLNVWADLLFRRFGVGVCPFSETPALLGTGPFRFTRNPMYLGLVALSAGAALLTGVLANLWITVAYVIWLHHAFVLPEEEFLRAQFGAGFEAYARRVPRWFGMPAR